VLSLSPRRVLDAGCGSGRVAGDLSARGIDVTSVGREELATMQLDRRFDVAVIAFGAPPWRSDAERRAVVHALVAHLEPGGWLVAGLPVEAGATSPAELDATAAQNGLALAGRWSSWTRAPHHPGDPYQVSAHRRVGTTTVHDLVARARAECRRVSPSELAGSPALVVDVRDSARRRRDGWIPGSVHVPATVVLWRLDPTSGYAEPALAGRPVVVVCDDGYASTLLAQQLRAVGIDATDLIGGMSAWVRAGLAVQRR
jgi:rhodanese-related sulfurtransferase